MAAVGDLMLGTDYPELRLPPDAGRGQLAAAAPLLQAADVAFGNLEGVLMDGGQPAKQCRDPSACYLFRSPSRFARTFAEAGFTVMSLANNHARDFGEEGRSATMAALAAAGLRHSGRAGDIASWTLDGLRVALIAFAPFKGSWPMLDLPAATAAVAELAAAHEVVIVSLHAGAEGPGAEHLPFAVEWYYGENRGDVVRFARAMVDAGADLVLGHGPHLPRAMELYRGRLIAYSLGNFATWWGISIRGAKGLAPLLALRLNGRGELLGGRIHSFRQRRPDGPRPDPTEQAAKMLHALSVSDLPDHGLAFTGPATFEPQRPPAACSSPST